MPEIRKYAAVFEKLVNQDVSERQYRTIEAYDAADALTQAKLMVEKDSRVGAIGALYESRAIEISPLEPPK